MNNMQDIIAMAKQYVNAVDKFDNDVAMQCVHGIASIVESNGKLGKFDIRSTKFVQSASFRRALAMVAVQFAIEYDEFINVDMEYTKTGSLFVDYMYHAKCAIQWLLDDNFANRVRLLKAFDHLLIICRAYGINVAKTIQDYLQ